MPPVITFLSDYGNDDEFVGVVHGVILKLCPEARVIDVSHGIPRQAVDLGARALLRALPYMPAGVHLAVVDPEVGARRRAVALRVAEEDRLLVGPDNGLLIPIAERFGGVATAVEISSSPWRLEPVSATFHGRDIFAPVAARLAAGEPLEDAGTPLEPSRARPDRAQPGPPRRRGQPPGARRGDRRLRQLVARRRPSARARRRLADRRSASSVTVGDRVPPGGVRAHVRRRQAPASCCSTRTPPAR